MIRSNYRELTAVQTATSPTSTAGARSLIVLVKKVTDQRLAGRRNVATSTARYFTFFRFTVVNSHQLVVLSVLPSSQFSAAGNMGNEGRERKQIWSAACQMEWGSPGKHDVIQSGAGVQLFAHPGSSRPRSLPEANSANVEGNFFYQASYHSYATVTILPASLTLGRPQPR